MVIELQKMLHLCKGYFAKILYFCLVQFLVMRSPARMF